MALETPVMNHSFPSGGGGAGNYIRLKDWRNTSLGDLNEWSSSLKITLNQLLNSKLPQCLFFRNEFYFFYNDVFCKKYLGDTISYLSMGGNTPTAWAETWTVIKPNVEKTLNYGEAFIEQQLIDGYKNGSFHKDLQELSYSPIYNENGNIEGVLITFTEPENHNLKAKNTALQQIIKESPVAMAIFRGPDWIIEMANNTMLKNIWRKEAHEVFGKKLLEVFPELETQPFPELLKLVALHKKVHYQKDAIALVQGHDGLKKFYLDFEYKPLFDDAQEVTGIMVTVNDVTEKAETAQQLKEAADRIQMATDGIKMATWDLNLQTRTIIYSARLNEIFGYSPETVMTHQELRDHVYPEDLSNIVDKAFEEALKTSIYFYEARILASKSSIRWIRTHGKILFDDRHRPIRMLGTMLDITEYKTAEEKIERLAAIVESSEDAIISKTLDGTITSWNASAERIFGYTANEILGKPIRLLLPENKAQEEADILVRLKKGERVEHFETQRLTKNNLLLDLSLSVSPLRDGNGTIIGASKIVRDITKQKHQERILHENEEKLNIIIEASELGTWELDLKTQEFTFSNRYKEIMGYDQTSELTRQDFLNRLHPDDSLIRENAFKDAFKKGYINYVTRVIWHDHTIHWVEAKGKVFYNALQEPIKLMGTARDLTDEQLYNQRLEESEKRFRLVANTAPVMIWMSAPDRSCLFCNKAWLTFTGLTMHEKKSKAWESNIHPDDVESSLHAIDEGFEHQKPFTIEYRLKRYDGQYRWVNDTAVPRFSSEGVFEGYIGACMDIHDRSVAEETLKESESRLRIAALSSELGTWNFEPVKRILRFDDASRKIFHIENNETASVDIELFWLRIHPDDREMVRKKISQALDPTMACTCDAEYRVLGYPDHKVRWLHAKGKAFFNERGVPYNFAGTLMDITDKRIALEELKESEQKFRLLADSMPQLIWTANADGNLNYCNQSFKEYTKEPFTECFTEGWMAFVHPDDLEKSKAEWFKSIKTGEPFLVEHRLKRASGEYRWQLSRAISQKDINGDIHMWVGTSMDIHDQKTFSQELELKVLERTKDLQQANHDLEKMNEELASFAYVSSHDLQEPLRKIQTFAARIIEKEPLSERGRDYFNRMQDAALRMQSLIEDLLAYSRTSTTEKNFEETNLNDILKEVENDLEQSIRENHAIITSENLPSVYVIPFQFRQLFTNIISNALKFAKQDVPSHIIIKTSMVKGQAIEDSQADPDKPYHLISISDNGIGFSKEYNAKIFELFQRLHGRSEYKGTGIGLAICKKIVENNHGFIKASGIEHIGATFYIYIPA